MDIKTQIIKIAKLLSADSDTYKYDPRHQNKPQDGGWLETDAGWTKTQHTEHDPEKTRPLNTIFKDVSKTVSLKDLTPTESMEQIGADKIQKGKKLFTEGKNLRDPITVRENNGKLEIIDGNTTYWNLKSLGYNKLPVRIDNSSKTLTELQEDAKKLNIQNVDFESKKELTKAIKKLNPPTHTPIHPPNIDSLPNKATQIGVTDKTSYYSQANEAFGEMATLLDRGVGLSKTIGAEVVDASQPSQKLVEALHSDKPVIVIGSIKGEKRAEEKVNSDYDGDWSKLTDGIRATISVKRINDLSNVYKLLEQKGLTLAQKPKDRYEHPTISGYRDILLNVRFPNGHIGELQINCHDMILAKKEGHKIYESVREIESRAKQEGRVELTDDELKQIAIANRKMKMIYNNAYKRLIRG